MIFFMRTKIFAILIFIFVINFKSFSQTYVGLTIGADFSTIHPKYIVNQKIYINAYKYLEYKFSNFSPGLIIEQKLGKYFSVDINSSFTNKELKIANVIPLFVPLNSFYFAYLKNSIEIKVYPASFFYLGIGKTYNRSYNFRYASGNGDDGVVVGDFEEFGWLFSCGFKYNNFFIDANLSNSESNILYLREDFNNRKLCQIGSYCYNFELSSLKPIQSYRIQFGYLFKIINAPKFERRSSVKCPKF